MKYQIRQKVFSFGDNFTIKGEDDEPRFIVKGKVFSFGDKLSIEDLYGNQLFYIEQKLFKLMPEYRIFQDGTEVAMVKRELTFFRPRFDIESSFGSFEMEGNVFGHNFEVLKDSRIVAVVNKKWLSFSDTYEVDIDDGENQGFLLALIIVIDQVIHDNNQNNN